MRLAAAHYVRVAWLFIGFATLALAWLIASPQAPGTAAVVLGGTGVVLALFHLPRFQRMTGALVMLALMAVEILAINRTEATHKLELARQAATFPMVGAQPSTPSGVIHLNIFNYGDMLLTGVAFDVVQPTRFKNLEGFYHADHVDVGVLPPRSYRQLSYSLHPEAVSYPAKDLYLFRLYTSNGTFSEGLQVRLDRFGHGLATRLTLTRDAVPPASSPQVLLISNWSDDKTVSHVHY